jgi:hypothetical protein
VLAIFCTLIKNFLAMKMFSLLVGDVSLFGRDLTWWKLLEGIRFKKKFGVYFVDDDILSPIPLERNSTNQLSSKGVLLEGFLSTYNNQLPSEDSKFLMRKDIRQQVDIETEKKRGVLVYVCIQSLSEVERFVHFSYLRHKPLLAHKIGEHTKSLLIHVRNSCGFHIEEGTEKKVIASFVCKHGRLVDVTPRKKRCFNLLLRVASNVVRKK